MSIIRDEFAVELNYGDREYTPQQVLDYMCNTGGEGYADKAQLDALRAESLGRARGVIERHGLKNDQKLKKSSSPVGKDLAELVLQHCDSVIGLIVEGGWRQGVLI